MERNRNSKRSRNTPSRMHRARRIRRKNRNRRPKQRTVRSQVWFVSICNGFSTVVSISWNALFVEECVRLPQSRGASGSKRIPHSSSRRNIPPNTGLRQENLTGRSLADNRRTAQQQHHAVLTHPQPRHRRGEMRTNRWNTTWSSFDKKRFACVSR